MKLSGTVLVVDDSLDTLRFLTEALDEAGMTVLIASSGEHALALTSEVMPDVILLDAMMPGMDGFDTCRHLKREAKLADVPVIFMTGLSDTEHVIRGLEAGGVDYVTKPIVTNELIARIRVHTANARKARSTSLALEAAGRSLIGVNAAGQFLWGTPQAQKMLGAMTEHGAIENIAAWLASNTAQPMSMKAPTGLALTLAMVSVLGPDEYLIALTKTREEADMSAIFRTRLSLTGREAEVLMWLTRGKSNKDISEILGLSARTVDKHLEQIYAKLGVENRTAAAILALRAREEG